MKGLDDWQKRWMAYGPEQARLLAEFETQYHAEHNADPTCHEEGPEQPVSRHSHLIA